MATGLRDGPPIQRQPEIPARFSNRPISTKFTPPLTLNNLSALYLVQRRHAEAEPLFRRTLGILEKALGPEHPDVAAGLNNLAVVYHAQGRLADAEPLFRRALAIAAPG